MSRMVSLDETVKEYLKQSRQNQRNAVSLLSKTGYGRLLATAGSAEARFKLRDCTLKDLRVAVIMDPLARDSFSPECQLQELTPEGWLVEIAQFRPDLILIESAWKGKDGLWAGKIVNGSKELSEMTDFCHQQKIPVVFWDDEDPVHTNAFLPAARAADVVFTTDLDCIEQYKTVLGHDQVFHLQFAAQPRLHHPIEKVERKPKFCFAGDWSSCYPRRARVFDAFAETLGRREGLDICIRDDRIDAPGSAFPERYAPLIINNTDETDPVWKGYTCGVNMNSVSRSQTVFDRRVFEMMASNTVVVSNYARGQKNCFGDLTICTDDAGEMQNELKRYAGTEDALRKYRLAGLRAVLGHHLYEHRLACIVERVFGKALLSPLPLVRVFAVAASEAEASRLLGMFRKQRYENKRMTIFADGLQADDPEITVFPVAEAEGKTISCFAAEDEFVAAFSAKDWYGDNYLTDLMLTLRYGTFEGVGKTAFFENGANGPECHDRHTVYRATEALCTTRAAIRQRHCDSMTVSAFRDGTTVRGSGLFAVDEFNYCGEWTEDNCEAAADLVIHDRGIPPEEINAAARSVAKTNEKTKTGSYLIDADRIAGLIPREEEKLTFTFVEDSIELNSTMAEDEHVCLWHKERIRCGDYLNGEKLPVLLKGSGDLETSCVCRFFDKDGQKIADDKFRLNRPAELVPPEGAVTAQIGLRIKGNGKVLLKKIVIGSDVGPDHLSAFLSRSDTLILSNNYPAYDDLYRNMFVHKRITSYREDDFVCDMFRMRKGEGHEYREFEGINVIEGFTDELEKILSGGRIKTVCVHFLNADMWSVLKRHLDHVRLIVWLHGAEVQPWWRRTFNFQDDLQLENAKAVSEKTMALWKEVFAENRGIPIHFVFVSQYFADEVMTDHQVTLSKDRYSIIHNCIDTEMFAYRKKDPEQRKRILTIKPFASRKYGNDITTKAIVALSKEPFFHDLHITVYGDGKLFDEDNAPLKDLGDNVELHREFLTQKQIAELHQQNGIYIATTRMDAQGVSRDEAMSSGLVPLANAVAAIPEFVDDDCGILVPAEDHMAVAAAIKRLYDDPALFERLSENAAKRVRGQTGRPYTIAKELELIGKKTAEGKPV